MTTLELEHERKEAREQDQPTVLLLDDDCGTLLVLHAVLERTAVRVIECEDEDCVLKLSKELAGIDLLVADIILKTSNGPAVVKAIRPHQPSMRVLYISGFSLSELMRRGLLHPEEMIAGQVEFLPKPFSPQEFLGTVEKLLERN